MALFQIEGKRLSLVRPKEFSIEREIQTLIEQNLQTVFNCRFVASEFPTGADHAGRIDTLALSEDNNPVIVEYKKVESSELVNQSLYYLSWIHDHRGDFQIAVNRALGSGVEVDWSDVRVICLAPGYRKFDLHAVQMMGANIELWQYHLFQNNVLYLEEVFRRSTGLMADRAISSKSPVMVAAGKKAALTRAQGSYTFEQHLEKASETIKGLVQDLREYILSLDESVEESPKKFYVAYKVAQNFVCMEVQRRKATLFLKLDPTDVSPLPPNARDVRKIGHYGTGDLEITVESADQVDAARNYTKMAFDEIGG